MRLVGAKPHWRIDLTALPDDQQDLSEQGETGTGLAVVSVVSMRCPERQTPALIGIRPHYSKKHVAR
jgi:hypothetical protein